jgi:hypothetical protein
MLETKVLHTSGEAFNIETGFETNSFKCYRKDSDTYKFVIEFEVKKAPTLQLLGEIRGKDGKVLNEDEILDTNGWVYFPKVDDPSKDGTPFERGNGNVMFDQVETVYFDIRFFLKGGGKTQSGM